MMAASYKYKKDLKAAVGETLKYVETSFFGQEYRADGTFCVVGPSPHERRWFAKVTMREGRIAKVE